MINIQQTVNQNQKCSDATKKSFWQLWQTMNQENKAELEKKFSEKPELLDKLLEILEKKKNAIENLNSSQIKEIVEQEKQLISEI